MRSFPIGQITNRLIEAGKLIDESQKAWVQEIRSNGGNKEAATSATEHIIPGGKTKLFDALSRDKCLVNVRIIGPPVMLAGLVDKEISWEFQKMQKSMHDMILRCSPGLEGLLYDLFTSRLELEDNGSPCSITYARFPYYLGHTVMTLVGQLNMLKVDNYNLKAEFFFGDGRKHKIKKSIPSYRPFELTVGGVPIPHLSEEERKQINGKPDLETIQANYVAICKAPELTDTQSQALQVGFSFLGKEYQGLQEQSKTYEVSSPLSSLDNKDRQKGTLMMAQLVLQDVAQSPLQQPKVYYMECIKKTHGWLEEDLLGMDKGDNLISFEPPFATSCFHLAQDWVYDAPHPTYPDKMEGMYMSWAMKYIITIDQQVKVTGFGLVFNQHCTGKSRLSKGPYLAHIFKLLLAKYGEQCLDGLISFVGNADGQRSPPKELLP